MKNTKKIRLFSFHWLRRIKTCKTRGNATLGKDARAQALANIPQQDMSETRALPNQAQRGGQVNSTGFNWPIASGR